LFCLTEATSKAKLLPTVFCPAGVVCDLTEGVSPVVIWAFSGIPVKARTIRKVSATVPVTLNIGLWLKLIWHAKECLSYREYSLRSARVGLNTQKMLVNWAKR
jgi:hypothetical protein